MDLYVVKVIAYYLEVGVRRPEEVDGGRERNQSGGEADDVAAVFRSGVGRYNDVDLIAGVGRWK